MRVSCSNIKQNEIRAHELGTSRCVGSDNLLSIVGFGSLLSLNSARSTFPELSNFRVCKLYGYRRCFAHVAPIFMKRGIAIMETKEIASLSVEPLNVASTSPIIVTQFEIPATEEAITAFVEREHEFRFVECTPETMDGALDARTGVLCARYSDEEYRNVRCVDENEYYTRYGQYGIDTIWRDDVLPCRVYLRHCVLASKNLGHDVYRNFITTTYLGDRQTTIQNHLENCPEIMDELPPVGLQERYGG